MKNEKKIIKSINMILVCFMIYGNGLIFFLSSIIYYKLELNNNIAFAVLLISFFNIIFFTEQIIKK